MDDDIDAFNAWLAQCIDETHSRQSEEDLLQEEWEKTQGKTGM